jgi:hypothetical protein
MHMLRVLVAGAMTLAAMTFGAGEARASSLSAADQLAVTQTVTGVGLFADLRDWGVVGALLADEITTDYTSVFGGEVATASRADLLAQWRDTLGGFDATQHLITNVAVDGSGDEASTLSHVRATHWVGGRSWTVGGVYSHRLVRSPAGWQVTYMALRKAYEEGDRSVFG